LTRPPVTTTRRAAVRLSRATRLFDGLAAVSQVSLEIAQGGSLQRHGVDALVR
jgi:hypothetical protein